MLFDWALADLAAAGQGPRPGRGARGREDPVHVPDPAALGASIEEPRCPPARPLPAGHLDWRLPGGARGPPRERRAEPLAFGDRAADGGLGERIRCLASP